MRKILETPISGTPTVRKYKVFQTEATRKSLMYINQSLRNLQVKQRRLEQMSETA